jgi:hypothetical protein
MTKNSLKSLLREYGDAIITFRSLNSNKLKYNVCTIDFECEYIQSKRNKAQESEETLLLFCWDTDTFRLIRPANVTSVIPLGKALGITTDYDYYHGYDER